MENNVILDETTRLDMRKQCEDSLYFLLRGVLKQNYLYPDFHIPICNEIQECATTGQPLLLVLNRGALKSTILSFGLPLWLAIKYGGNVRILVGTNTIDNAAKFGRKLKLVIEHNMLFRTLFPELIPDNVSAQKWSDLSICLKRSEDHQESTFEFASLGTQITSRHYNIVISDDILSPRKDSFSGSEIMPTVEDVEKCIGWHRLLDSILIHDFKIPDIIMDAGTRWSKFDYIQYLLDNDKRYKVVDIPAINEKGEAVYPTRYSLKTLQSIRERQGEYIFSSQYLNHPYDATKMLFRQDDIQYYDELPGDIPMVCCNDPAWSKNKSACNSVSIVLGYNEDAIYVVDYKAKKISPTELCNIICDFVKQYPLIRQVSMETVAGQIAYTDLLKVAFSNMGIYKSITEFIPRGDKVERLLSTIEPILKRRKLFIRRSQTELITELLDFPYGKYRDIIDTLSQGIILNRNNNPRLVPVDMESDTGFTLDSIMQSLNKTYGMFKWQESKQREVRYANIGN